MGKGKTRRRKKRRAPAAVKGAYTRALLRVGGVIAGLIALAALAWLAYAAFLGGLLPAGP